MDDWSYRSEDIRTFPTQEGFPPFSVAYEDWIDRYGFWVRDSWDSVKKRFGGRGWMDLQPIHRRVLSYALRFNHDTGSFYFDTILFSAIKKSAKTTLSASVAMWYAENCPDNSEIYVIANSREQAEGRVMKDIRFHAEKRGYKVTVDGVTLPNGTEIRSMSTSYSTSAGSRHSLVLWDELWGAVNESDRRVFEEMTPIPTIPHSLRFISTYAGFYGESELLWELYLAGVGRDEHEEGRGKKIPELRDLPCWVNGKQFTFWSHEPIAEWQFDPEYYQNQRMTLRPEAYLRLHENRWVHPNQTFITPAMWEVAERFPFSAEIWKAHPFRYLPVYVGIDSAPKHDRTVVTGVAFDPNESAVGEVFHRIWTPKSGEVLDFEQTIESYLIEMASQFKIRMIVYDPAHMHQTARRLRMKGFNMVEWAQTPANMVKATMALYDVLRLGRFATWRDEEARQHIFTATVKPEMSGFRLVKPNKTNVHSKPIDYAVALAMAVMMAVEEGGLVVMDELKVDYPFSDSDASLFFSDPTIYDKISKIPFELRTEQDEEFLQQWTIT